MTWKGGFRLFGVLAFLVMELVAVSCSGEKIRQVEAILFIDFEKVQFGVNLNDATVLPNSYCFDDDGKIYLLDSQNHRVIKLDMQGTQVMQIGKIGQEEGDLFNPRGIFTVGNELYILNDNGKEVKRFTRDGKFISGFKLQGESPQAHSFLAAKNLIFVNQVEMENSDGKLIYIYTPEGKLLKKIGKGYVIFNYAANLAFNNAYMLISDDILYGCFRTSPVFFRIRLDTEEVLFKKLEFKEFMDIENRAKQSGLNPPGYYSDKSTALIKRVGFAAYCNGITVGQEGDVYICSNVDKGVKGMIFRMDPDGNLKERILIRFKGRIPRVIKIFSRDDGFFVLVELARVLYLAKIDI